MPSNGYFSGADMGGLKPIKVGRPQRDRSKNKRQRAARKASR